MKKALILALFLAPSVAFAAFNVDLHYGSKGDDVTALQEYLTDQGVYTGPITGNFYILTLSAVRKYQKASGITPISGFVGPITRGVINAQLEAVAPDSEGDAVVITPVPTPTPVVAPAIQPQALISAPAPEVTRVTPTLSVNGVEGTSTIGFDGCIRGGEKTCGHAEVKWSGTGACGITAAPYIGWAGNYGTQGTNVGQFSASSTLVTLQCSNGIATSTVVLQ